MAETVECPFCGGQMVIVECDRPLDGYWARYVCRDCNAYAKGAYCQITRADARRIALKNAKRRPEARVMEREQLKAGTDMPNVITIEKKDESEVVIGTRSIARATEYDILNDTGVFSFEDGVTDNEWAEYGKTWRVWRGVADETARKYKEWVV